jgi:hypothetical protein
MKRPSVFWRVLIPALLIVCIPASSAFAQSLSKGKGDLRVMTYNINEGTDYLEVQAATTSQEFLLGVGQTILQVRANEPHGRMKAVAQQILAAAPMLVSLQEIDKWFTGSLNLSTGQCDNMKLEVDMLADLMKALAQQGGHYQVAKLAEQWEFPGIPGFIPPSNFLCVGVIDYIAILARTDVPKLSWSNPQAQRYINTLMFPTPAGVVPFYRAWASVDANFNGKEFRLINTHLESVDAHIRREQAEELRTGPANTSLPVVLAMDSNAQAFPLPQDPTYLDFLVAGFQDAWTELFPGLPGFTSGQAQFLDNKESQLNTRIDLILTFGRVRPQRIALFGDKETAKTPGGLWASDHAGVAAQLIVQKGN